MTTKLTAHPDQACPFAIHNVAKGVTLEEAYDVHEQLRNARLKRPERNIIDNRLVAKHANAMARIAQLRRR